MTVESDSPYLDEKEAAALIGVSVHALRRWRQRSVGPAYRRLRGDRGRILYRRVDLIEFVETYRVDTSESAGLSKP